MTATLDQTQIAEQVKDFIAKNLLFSKDGFHYPDEASFLDEGIVDSLGIIELVAFIEGTFGISVADVELVPDNFDSVQKLATYVWRKQAGQA